MTMHKLRSLSGSAAGATDKDSTSDLTNSDWVRIRAPVRQRDLVLSDKAQRWLKRLPAEARPTELAKQFPRIVNRIAALWRDEGLTEFTLDDLLGDKRGGRRGFPATIVAELSVLYELHVARLDELPRQTDWVQLDTET